MIPIQRAHAETEFADELAAPARSDGSSAATRREKGSLQG